MQWVAALLSELGIGPSGAGQHEAKAFPDGAAFRIEIPSVEGPRVLEAVLNAAEAEGITVNRVSQGSGAGLLRASELRAMAQAGHDAGVEVCLFIGPRERYGIGAHPRSSDGSAQGDQVRGTRQLGYALEDVLRATEQGIRSFLVADLGLLVALRKAQERGDLPEGIVWKVSAAMAPSNPLTLKLLERLGGSTLTVNVPSDVTIGELAEMRAAISVPIDLYVESPDALGGIVRGNEVGDLIVAGAPLRQVRAAQRGAGLPERPPPGSGRRRQLRREGAPGRDRARVAGAPVPRPGAVQAGRGRPRHPRCRVIRTGAR